jgi:hypothetical protein
MKHNVTITAVAREFAGFISPKNLHFSPQLQPLRIRGASLVVAFGLDPECTRV